MSANTMPLGTILVADDNQSARDILEIMLRNHGYRVLSAADGPQALAALEEEAIDLALIDVVMPGQSGFAVCRAVKDRPDTRLTPVCPYHRTRLRGRAHPGNRGRRRRLSQ